MALTQVTADMLDPSARVIYRTKFITSGTTYTTPSDVSALYVFVTGSTGGRTGVVTNGGMGGAGYSETYYPSPAASYTYSIGAGGANTGGAGGTTTFDVMSVSGGSGVTSGTGSAGGVGSGGTYNAIGGTGGNGATAQPGGCGGFASRAGNGGNGGNAVASTTGGGGGGTGGNGSGATGGAAATAKNASAIVLPFGQTVENFGSGGNGYAGGGGNGAYAACWMNVTLPGIPTGTHFSSNPLFAYTVSGMFHAGPVQTQPQSAALTGSAGYITIIEVLK